MLILIGASVGLVIFILLNVLAYNNWRSKGKYNYSDTPIGIIFIFLIFCTSLIVTVYLFSTVCNVQDKLNINNDKMVIENKITNYNLLKNNYANTGKIDIANNNYFSTLITERIYIVKLINEYNVNIIYRQMYQKNNLWFVNIHDWSDYKKLSVEF